ncbi:MAG: ribosomal protein L1 [Gammaproteobacteria bacterium]|jgi:uncharacterized membrane-anchored protein YjiN (DUF445 family)
MPEKQLRENLEKLRAEIDQVADSDTQARARLNTLINEIEACIDPEQETEDQNIADNIKEAVTQFETEHPRATAILNDIMVTLSNMGI